MSKDPEAYNRTVGPALTVLVMDTVRQLVAEKGHTTQPEVLRCIAKQLGEPAKLGGRIYENVQGRVRALRAAGLIETEKKYHDDGRAIAFTLLIRLPNVQP